MESKPLTGMFLSAPKQVIRELIVLQLVATDSHRQMEQTPSKPGKRWFGVEVTLALNFTIGWFPRIPGTLGSPGLTSFGNADETTCSLGTSSSLAQTPQSRQATATLHCFTIIWDSLWQLLGVFMENPLKIFHLLMSPKTTWEWHFGCPCSSIKIYIHIKDASPWEHSRAVLPQPQRPLAMLQPWVRALLSWPGSRTDALWERHLGLLLLAPSLCKGLRQECASANSRAHNRIYIHTCM